MDLPKGDGRVRLVRRSSSDSDHLAVLAGLGVKLPTLTAEAAPLRGDTRVAHMTGGVRHAEGDAMASLASRSVSRAEAERILATPAVARRLARGVIAQKRQEGGNEVVETEEFETFEIPLSPTIPGGQDAQ